MLTADDGRDLPPGWYADLADRVERFWDGSMWTKSRPLGAGVAAESLRSQRRTERNTRRIFILLVVVIVWVVIALVLRNLTK